MPTKAQAVIDPAARYKVLWGGRGSGKSYSFADGLIAKTHQAKKRILCTRENQNSIKDSVHRLLSDQIYACGLSPFFRIQQDSILGHNGSEFIFKGLRHNISEIKSLEGIDICWCEEAEKISQDSWNILIPTIRKPNSEIWVSFNPEEEASATYQRFVVNPPPSCLSAFMTWEDNDYFPEVLRQDMEYDKRVDFEKYEHIWLGKLKKYGNALVFRGKFIVEDFTTPDGARFYFGADFGYSSDPSCLVRCFIKDRTLFIDHEAYGHGVEIDQLHQFYESVPESHKWKIVGDSARPDTISFLTRPHPDPRIGISGFRIVGAKKGKGSVEDGIQFLRSFEKIVIHPRCKGAKDNFENFKWKVDPISGEILPIPVDKNNHITDALAYALEDYIKASVSIFDVLGKREKT